MLKTLSPSCFTSPCYLQMLCRIEMMKEGSFLLNVSRGGLVNSDELIAALERGQLAGIGLDVWENEGERGWACQGGSGGKGVWQSWVREGGGRCGRGQLASIGLDVWEDACVGVVLGVGGGGGRQAVLMW